MKSKHIKSVLRRKFKAWADSIEDENVKQAVEKDGLITGGAIASMLMGESVNDYDVYFKTSETAFLVADYYVAKFMKRPPSRFKDSEKIINIKVVKEDTRVKIVVKSAGIAGEATQDDYQYFEQADGEGNAQDYVEDALEATKENTDDLPKYRPVFLSANAITLSNDVQLIIRFCGEADVIHENYDFVHCTCSWDAKTGILLLPPKALEALLTKDLYYLGGSKYPLCSIIRTRKFIQRGWKITAGQYVKMCWDLNQLDLNDIKILEDQMTGVDAAYFTEVIAKLREKNGEKVDGACLMEVIDRIF